MGSRVLAASQFGGACAAFWGGCALLVMTPEVALRIGRITGVGAMAMGAVAAPHLARFARRATEPWRSIGAGAVLTGGLYVLSACVLAVLVLFAMNREASISAAQIRPSPSIVMYPSRSRARLSVWTSTLSDFAKSARVVSSSFTARCTIRRIEVWLRRAYWSVRGVTAVSPGVQDGYAPIR